MLATFCSLGKTHIENANNRFAKSRFINDHVPTLSEFIQQTDVPVGSFFNITKSDFAGTLDWIVLTFTINTFLASNNVHSDIMVDGNRKMNVESTLLETLSMINPHAILLTRLCSCESDNRWCSITSLLYTNGSHLLEYSQTFSEIPISYLLLTVFLQPKIDWWYNRTYLENIKSTYSIMDRSQLSPNLEPPSMLMPSAFKDLK